MTSLAEELAMLNSGMSTIEDARQDLNAMFEYMRHMPGQQDDFIPTFGKMRKLKVETINMFKGFMMNPDIPEVNIPKEFKHDSLGLYRAGRNMMEGRFVLSVGDVKGNTAGMVGYDFEGHPKYLDSLNYGYKAKFSGFMGMEFLPEYYRDGYILVCEGPICLLYCKEHGLPAVSSLGSKLSPYMVTILKRFENRCLVVPDGHGDEAGLAYRESVMRKLPLVRCVQPKFAKDIDDTRKWLAEREPDGEEIIANELDKLLHNQFYESDFFE